MRSSRSKETPTTTVPTTITKAPIIFRLYKAIGKFTDAHSAKLRYAWRWGWIPSLLLWIFISPPHVDMIGLSPFILRWLRDPAPIRSIVDDYK